MTVAPQNRLGALPVLGCVIALVLVIFAAIRLIGNSSDVRPYTVSAATVGTALGASAEKPKERVRYQATIDNWRRYRSATSTELR
jgi:hypothetical protein